MSDAIKIVYAKTGGPWKHDDAEQYCTMSASYLLPVSEAEKLRKHLTEGFEKVVPPWPPYEDGSY